MATSAAKQKAANEAATAKTKAAAAAATAKAKPAPAPKPSTPAPAAPTRVDPFFTPDDLAAINQFGTDLATKLESIDTGLTNLQTDTTYQKTQNDTSAKKGASAAQDDAISRGIFASSIKDATLYDIEAQRSLASKFLDDKLTTARLSAGTQKTTLATAKTNFDTNMAARSVANAQGVNDTNSSGFATAQAAWAAANPAAAAAAAAPPRVTASGAISPPSAPQPKPPTAPKPVNQSSTQTGNTNTKPAIATPKKPTKPKVVYGGRG